MIAQRTQIASAQKLATRNVMSPGIWFCAVILPPCIFALVKTEQWVAIWLMILISIVIITNIGIYIYHSINNPILLQSEDYLLRKDALTIYGSSSYSGEQVVKIINAPVNLSLPGNTPRENGE